MSRSTRRQGMEKYGVRATLRKIYWGRASGFAQLSVGNLCLNVFIPFMFGQEDMDLIESCLYKELEVNFSLCDYNVDATTEKEKKIVEVPSEPTPYQCETWKGANEYEVLGEVIDRFPASKEDWEGVVVDCGIPIRISTKPGIFRVGDWVRANGRVDISFAAQSADSFEPHIRAELL